MAFLYLMTKGLVMKKIVLTYGLMAGSIVAAMMFATLPLWDSGVLNFDNGELVGYTTMVIALSMIFFGIKSYRDNYSKGSITFWDGCKIGLLITLIASVMYALAWEISYATMSGDFTKEMSDHYLEELRSGEVSPEELKKAEEEWASFSEMYKNPVVRFGVTLMEITPVGILITLLSAGLLRRKEFFPSTEYVKQE